MPPHTDPNGVTFPIAVLAATYHTIDHTEEHVEGEVYQVDTPELLSTLIGCGFIDQVEPDPKPGHGQGPTRTTAPLAGPTPAADRPAAHRPSRKG